MGNRVLEREREFPIMGEPQKKSIPWAMIAPYEERALKNHDQTLERLAQRGGLSVCEALAVLERRKYKLMDPAEALSRLNRYITIWMQGVLYGKLR